MAFSATLRACQTALELFGPLLNIVALTGSEHLFLAIMQAIIKILNHHMIVNLALAVVLDAFWIFPQGPSQLSKLSMLDLCLMVDLRAHLPVIGR
jgi:hypothetical protein